MSVERVILCGSLAAAGGGSKKGTVRLHLWGKHANVNLKISDISERMVANIPPVLVNLLLGETSRSSQVSAGQIRTFKICTFQVCTFQIRTDQHRTGQICIEQVRTVQTNPVRCARMNK